MRTQKICNLNVKRAMITSQSSKPERRRPGIAVIVGRRRPSDVGRLHSTLYCFKSCFLEDWPQLKKKNGTVEREKKKMRLIFILFLKRKREPDRMR